jgi:hypothetical protein
MPCAGEDQCMTVLYRRPAGRIPLSVGPQLASWDRGGSPSQVRLGQFLDHAEALAMPAMATRQGPFSVELTVGLSDHLPLTGGGRDLDNYLFPLAQRLGATRIAAMFGRKVHGSSFLSIDLAEPDDAIPAQFSVRLAGSYARKEWKIDLRERLLKAHCPVPGTGPVGIVISIATGPGRNWANIWKPSLDAFGPVLGEDPLRPFHPNDDRVTDLGLHHHLDNAIGHDVIVTASWASLKGGP